VDFKYKILIKVTGYNLVPPYWCPSGAFNESPWRGVLDVHVGVLIGGLGGIVFTSIRTSNADRLRQKVPHG